MYRLQIYIPTAMVRYHCPFQVKTTTAAESAEKLFQPRTVLYMWYCLAAWVLIFILFVLWEFLYWRPKHRRRKSMFFPVLEKLFVPFTCYIKLLLNS